MKQDARELASVAGMAERPAAEVARLTWLRSVLQGQPRQLLSRLGIPGVTAIGMLIACAAFYVSVMMPMDARIDAARDSVLALTDRVEQATSGARQGALSVTEQLAEFHRLFPRQDQLTDTVDKVFQAAISQGISLQQGEYRMAEDPAGKLQRFQMLLPMKTEYPRIRRFLAHLATEVPTMALEHIQFERQKIGDTQVEATIKLALYVEQGS
jgi:hypothetical protein